MNLGSVDRWIHITVAADVGMALFVHFSDTPCPLRVAVRLLGAAGGPLTTVRVKDWVAAGLPPFVAVIVNGYVPPVPAAGVPASVAVPSQLSVNVTPDGSAPVSDKAALGTPVDLTVKVPARPVVKVSAGRAGDLGCLENGEDEGLGGVRTDTVRGGDLEQVRTAGARSRCSRDCRRAVPVVA